MLRRTFAASLIAVSLLTSSLPAQAGGVPTISVAELTQLVMNAQQQAKEALAQLEAARDAISQAKGQYDHYKSIVQGNDKLGDFLNDPLLNELLPVKDWKTLYDQTADLGNLRERYGLSSNNPDVQAAFDKMLMQADVLEKQYNATGQRIQNAKALRGQLNTVEDPKAREQLALRYQQEQLEIQNQQLQLQNTQALMEQQKRFDQKKYDQEYLDYMNGKRATRPHNSVQG